MHRKNQPCASCHKIMDPIGFALENFDADGKWRTKQGGDGGVPIDASVDLFDGQQVNGTGRACGRRCCGIRRSSSGCSPRR